MRKVSSVSCIPQWEETHLRLVSKTQAVLYQLRVLCLQYSHLKDELSVKIQEVLKGVIFKNPSHPLELNKKSFDAILCNDFDQAPLQELVLIGGWRFEAWQLRDFIILDKFFNQRPRALSPFDQQPIPEEFPKHPFAQEVVRLIGKLSTSEPSLGLNHSTRQYAEDNPPEKDITKAYQRYKMWERLAMASLREKKRKEDGEQRENHVAAQRRVNQNLLYELINAQAQRLLVQFKESQPATQEKIDEFEQMRVQMTQLTARLEEATLKIKALKENLIVQEKKSEDLQKQIYNEQQKYVQLAYEVQELHRKCKKKKWWKF